MSGGHLQGSSARADSESLTEPQELSSPVKLPGSLESENIAANRCGVEKDPGTHVTHQGDAEEEEVPIGNWQRSMPLPAPKGFLESSSAYLCRRMLLIKIKKK